MSKVLKDSLVPIIALSIMGVVLSSVLRLLGFDVSKLDGIFYVIVIVVGSFSFIALTFIVVKHHELFLGIAILAIIVWSFLY